MHLPPKHIEDAFHSLCLFANRQLDAWKRKVKHMKQGEGKKGVRSARVLSGCAPTHLRCSRRQTYGYGPWTGCTQQVIYIYIYMYMYIYIYIYMYIYICIYIYIVLPYRVRSELVLRDVVGNSDVW